MKRLPTDKPAVTLESLDLGDRQIRSVLERVRKAVASDLSLLLEGESGTGKDLLAAAAHASGPRRAGPLVATSCAALPADAMDAHLFGDDRNALPGLVRQAHGGTLFLDDVEQLDAQAQARLLGVLKDGGLSPPGGGPAEAVDFFLVTATNVALRDRVADGRFSDDLLYRLGRMVVRIPPLRQRSDLPSLVDYWLRQRAPGEQHLAVSAEVMKLFARHPWPGNVRQLFNVLRAGAAMAAEHGVILPDDLPVDFLDDAEGMPGPAHGESLVEQETRAVRAALDRTGGNVAAAARLLGVSRGTVYRKLRAGQRGDETASPSTK